MGELSMLRKPELIVFAGPNGSGKSTITKMAKVIEPYINADDIKRTILCTNLEAAEIAGKLRYEAISKGIGFTFETVLSTTRNLELIEYAKSQGYFVRCIYVLTDNPSVNIARVMTRVAAGGHDVPMDKIVSRYHKALSLIPRLLKSCDICHIYDNTEMPFRIFKKRKDMYFYWANEDWSKERIKNLTQVEI